MITLLLINTFLCLGFYQACAYKLTYGNGVNLEHSGIIDKQFLWFIGYHTRYWSDWIQKPLHKCMMCMASIHSYPYWIIKDFTLENLYFYPVYILALAGLNFVLDQITTKLSE